MLNKESDSTRSTRHKIYPEIFLFNRSWVPHDFCVHWGGNLQAYRYVFNILQPTAEFLVLENATSQV